MVFNCTVLFKWLKLHSCNNFQWIETLISWQSMLHISLRHHMFIHGKVCLSRAIGSYTAVWSSQSVALFTLELVLVLDLTFFPYCCFCASPLIFFPFFFYKNSKLRNKYYLIFVATSEKNPSFFCHNLVWLST